MKKKTGKFKIGFMQGRLVGSENKQYYQFFPAQKWKKEFKLASKANIKTLELTANLINLSKNPVYNKSLKEIYYFEKEKNNLNIDSLTCDFFMEKPFFKLKKNSADYKIATQTLMQTITTSQKIGIRKFVIPLVDNSSIKNSTEERKLLKYFNSLEFKKILNKNTQILFESDYHPKKLLRFIKKFRRKIFGINYDSGNSASLKYRFSEEKNYFKYVKNIHIKDRVYKGKSVDLGKGVAELKSLKKYLKKINYKGNLIFQTAMPKKNYISKLKKNIKYFHKLV